MKPVIAITTGDPNGCGPEIVLKALSSENLFSRCVPLVIGDFNVLDKISRLLGTDCIFNRVTKFSRRDLLGGKVNVLDLQNMPEKFWTPGRVNKASGRASLEYIRTAVELCQQGKTAAMVTGPISKKAISLAGCPHPGHTELIAELIGTKEPMMTFISDRLKVLVVTRHIPLKQVFFELSVGLIERSITIAGRIMLALGKKNSVIAVAGLNPHAGEDGMLGNEEKSLIEPAIRLCREKHGFNVIGPVPPDVVFRQALEGRFDFVVALYHDQGLIPFKMFCFDEGVNYTANIPIIRTSVDHGVALDIAGKGTASPRSLIAAIDLALKLI